MVWGGGVWSRGYGPREVQSWEIWFKGYSPGGMVPGVYGPKGYGPGGYGPKGVCSRGDSPGGHCGKALTLPPVHRGQNDIHLWTHYLPATSLEGGNYYRLCKNPIFPWIRIHSYPGYFQLVGIDLLMWRTSRTTAEIYPCFWGIMFNFQAAKISMPSCFEGIWFLVVISKFTLSFTQENLKGVVIGFWLRLIDTWSALIPPSI